MKFFHQLAGQKAPRRQRQSQNAGHLHAQSVGKREHMVVKRGQPRHDALLHHHKQKRAQHKENHQRQRNQLDHAHKIFGGAALAFGHVHIHFGKQQQQKRQRHQPRQQKVNAQPRIRVGRIEKGRKNKISRSDADHEKALDGAHHGVVLFLAAGEKADHRIHRHFDERKRHADGGKQHFRAAEAVARVHIQASAKHQRQTQQHAVFIAELRQKRSHEKRNESDGQIFKRFQNAGLGFGNTVIGQRLLDNDAHAVEQYRKHKIIDKQRGFDAGIFVHGEGSLLRNKY